MRVYFSLFSIFLFAVFSIAACAPSVGRLHQLADRGQFAEAASAVLGDPDMAAELAALVLEKAAVAPEHLYLAVERLSCAGKAGRRALKRMSMRQDATGRAARIAFHRYDKPDTEITAQCVSDPWADVRRLCVYAWNSVLPEEMLKRFLLDTDPEARLFALKGLAALPADKAREPLFADALLRDPSPRVRAEAARHGALLGGDALLLLKDRLSDNNLGIRTAAVSGLATLKNRAATDLLTAVARGPLDEVALTAAAEIAALGGADGRERLLQGVADTRPSIRAASFYLLFRAKIENASAILVQHLDDKAPEVVLAAANLLRKDETARDAVTAALRKIATSKTAKSAQARDLLAVLGDASAMRQVADILKNAASMNEAELTALLTRVAGASGLFDDFVRRMGDPREGARIQAALNVLFPMSKT